MPEGAIDWLVPTRGGSVVSRESEMVTGEELLDVLAGRGPAVHSSGQVAHLRPTLWRAKPETMRPRLSRYARGLPLDCTIVIELGE